MTGGIDLGGAEVLLVEDDLLIRQDLADTLTDYGARVTATGWIAEAMAMAEGEIEHAILDVKLEDGHVHPVARRLAERGVPFTFHSSAARCTRLAEAFPAARVLPKPAIPAALAALIRQSIDQGTNA